MSLKVLKDIFLILIIAIVLLFLTNIISSKTNNKCYCCDDNSFVVFTGTDTMEKRVLAFEIFRCIVIGTTINCKADRKILDAFLK